MDANQLAVAEADTDRAMEIFQLVKPFLQGESCEVQAAVLVQCLGIWTAGFYRSGEAVMDDVLRDITAAARRLVPIILGKENLQ